MEFATGALGTLLPKLGRLLQDEYNLQKGVKKDIEFLERELKSMHAALRTVGEMPREQINELVGIWARDVRELSYNMEDIIDTFLVQVEGPELPSKRSTKRFIKKMIRNVTKAMTRHGIAQEIKDIKKLVQEVAERRYRYNVDSLTPAKTFDVDPRMTALYTKATDLVGIDEAKKDLIAMLTKGDYMCVQQQRVVSVVGFGGLGKTTLAKAVYDELKVQFDCTAFVSVSRRPDRKQVLKNILYELDRKAFGDIHNKMLEEVHLIDQVREFLQNKRYLIVIDDIWEAHCWEIIKHVFFMNSCGSRIITTTRNIDVAKEADQIYRLQPLTYNNSKKLFYMRIFGDEGKFLDGEPDEVSDKMLKKCDGIPLAVITMASLLVGKPREIWSEFYTAIGFGHKDNMQVENTMKILSFSYYDMPSHLRTCLLYLSVFPEDYVIYKKSLIWMWIAEGFIYMEQGHGLFELGERYFTDLINRSMIQAVESEYDGTVRGCRVHDMVLDLIRSLAQEENFVTILDNGEDPLPQKKKKVRRIALQRSIAEPITHQSDHMDMLHLRSYIAFLCRINQQATCFSFATLLRVLAIEDCQVKDDWGLENLGSLIQLRYLSLRRTNIRKLPEQIGDLKFLQTLDIMEGWIDELPASIVRLTQLLCLFCSGLLREVPVSIENLTSLEQLTINFHYDVDVDKIRRFIKELGRLRQLSVLKLIYCSSSPKLTDESAQRNLVESLRNLNKIQHLEVYNLRSEAIADADKWDAAGFVLPQHICRLSLSCVWFSSRLPSCISSLHHLSYMELLGATEESLKLLGRLTELRYLKLYYPKATVTVSKINAGDSFFPNLRFLNIRGGMVQIEHNVEDSSFSFCICNGFEPMPFCSRRNGVSSVPCAVMPNLEVLEVTVSVRALKGDNGGCSSNTGMEYLTSLRKVKVNVHTQVEEVETALKDVIDVHPNHPTLEFKRW